MDSNFNIPLLKKVSNLFTMKTALSRNKITSDFSNNTCNIATNANLMFNGKMIDMFGGTSSAETKETIRKSLNKSRDLYLLPSLDQLCYR